MSTDENIRAQLDRLRSAISEGFRSWVVELVRLHGTDLCMAGLATASDLGYLAPVCAFRTNFANAENIPKSELFGRALYEPSYPEDVELSAINELLEEVQSNEPATELTLVYQAIVDGMEDAKAHELAGENGEQFAIIAFLINGTDWGMEPVIRRLNPWQDFEEIFPPREWQKEGLAEYRGPKSSWGNPWGTDNIMTLADGVLFSSFHELWKISLQSDEITKVHATPGNGFTGARLIPGRNIVLCVAQYGAECFDLDASAVIWRISVKYRFKSISFSPSGDFFVAGAVDGPATVWSSADGSYITELPHDEKDAWVMTAQWSPNGDQIVTSGRNLGIRFWDAQSFALLEEIPNGGDQLEYFQNGSRIAVASGYSRYSSNHVRVLNLADGSWQTFEKTSQDMVNRLRISSDGTLIAAFTGQLSSHVEVYNAAGNRISTIAVWLQVQDALFLDQNSILLGGDWHEPTGPFIQWRFRETVR